MVPERVAAGSMGVAFDLQNFSLRPMHHTWLSGQSAIAIAMDI
jgi:hypothetical protein